MSPTQSELFSQQQVCKRRKGQQDTQQQKHNPATLIFARRRFDDATYAQEPTIEPATENRGGGDAGEGASRHIKR